MEAQSTFLDRLSPETRISIYSHVFGTSLVVKPSSSETALGMKKHRPVDTVYLSETDTKPETSILATSGFIYNEALPVLYRDKIIRGTTRDFKQLLEKNSNFIEHARHVEIADCVSTYRDDDFHSILYRLQSLPRVRSLTILSDCLYSLSENARPRLYTVSRFCEEANLGEATCVDIGRYQLHGKFSRFQFVHRRLVQLWPDVKSTPEDYDAFEDFDSMRTKWPPRGNSQDFPRWYLQTSLRCWVGLADEIRKIKLAHSLEPHEVDSVECPHLPEGARLEIFARWFTSTCPFDFISLDMNTDSGIGRLVTDLPIHQLGPGHGHEVLSLITEVLSLETTIYHSEYDNNDRPQKRWREAHWAETDGCMPTIEFMLMHQDIARAGLPDTHYFQNPVRPQELEVMDRVELWIYQQSFMCQGIYPCSHRHEVSLFGYLEKTQLGKLYFAMMNYSFDRDRPDDGNYISDLNSWSADLLRRYILASGQAEPLEVEMLENVDAEDLRSIVRAVQHLLGPWGVNDKEEFLRLAPPKRTFAPEDFDDDLYEPFAWLYGPLLLDCCRSYLNTSILGLNWEYYLTDRYADSSPSFLHSYANRGA